MHIKYVVLTLYEGKCPSCGEYQNSHISPESVDKECSRCKEKKVKDILINGSVIITEIGGNWISGYQIYLSVKGKNYIIEANKFYEVKKDKVMRAEKKLDKYD